MVRISRAQATLRTTSASSDLESLCTTFFSCETQMPKDGVVVVPPCLRIRLMCVVVNSRH